MRERRAWRWLRLRRIANWGRGFNVFVWIRKGVQPEAISDPRWVLTWKMIDGKEGAKTGSADTSGCASPRPYHLQVISLGARNEWEFRRLDFKDAVLQEWGDAGMLRGESNCPPGAPNAPLRDKAGISVSGAKAVNFSRPPSISTGISAAQRGSP